MSIKEKLSHVLNSEDDDDGQQPYIGPRAFRRVEADRLRFSGRDTEIDEIVALITSHRIVLIYAQSGAGKTSIINAGVIPSLAKDGFEVLPVARVQVTSPTSPVSPKNGNNNIPSKVENIYIYNALQSLGRERPEIKPESISDLALFEFLDRYFPTRKNENGEIRPQLLIFDQLEELFSFYPDNWIEQQRNFFQQVADSLDNNPFLRVVFVIREDFLAQLDPFKSILPEKLRARFRLERLHRREAISAIKKPLKKVLEKATEDEKANIESEINALVNELRKMNVVEVSSGDIRPLEGDYIEPIQLQVVCKRWWREREASKGLQNKVTSLEELGTVDEALEDFYEDAILAASKETRVHESKIRIWCQEKLITPSGTRSMVHRGQNTTEGIDNNVIDWLERKYLIRKEHRSGASWYELTHDRLIKPIISSNAKWKDVNDRKKNRKIIIKSGLAVAAATIIILYVILPFLVNIYPPLPTSYEKSDVTVGKSPTRVAVNPNTVQTYVANAASDSISAISEQTPISSGQKNREIGQQTIPENAGPENIAVNPTTNNNTEIGQQTIPLDIGPNSIAVNPTTNTIYVRDYNSGTVSVIDGTTKSVMGSIRAADAVNDVAVNPNTNTIYVASSAMALGTLYGENGTISVIDGTTNSMERIDVGGDPKNVAVNPNNNTIYVTDYNSSIVSVIEGKTNSVMGSIDVGGSSPTSIAVNPNNNTIYVADTHSNRVSVIDGRTNSVMGSIDVGSTPNFIQVNPTTNTIYVGTYGSSTISIINGATNSVMNNSIDVGGVINDIHVHPTTNTIYVASSATDPDTRHRENGTVSIIDGATNREVKRIKVGGDALDVAVNPNTNTIYVAKYDWSTHSSTVSVINATTTNGTVTSGLEPNDIPMEAGRPFYMAINPATNTIYATSDDQDTFYALNSTTNSLVKISRVDDGPQDIAVNPNTNTIYVASWYSSKIDVIDGTTNSVVGSIPLGDPVTEQANDVAVNPNTNTIYVASSSSDPRIPYAAKGTVSVIDGATRSGLTSGLEPEEIVVGSRPNDVAVNPNTNTIYVAESDSNRVSVIEGKANSVLGKVSVNGSPTSIAVNPNTNTIYVTDTLSSKISVIDGTTINGTTTNSVMGSIDVGSRPTSIAVNPNTNTIYVASYNSSTINVIDGRTNSVMGSIDVGGSSPTSVLRSVIDGRTNSVMGSIDVGSRPTSIAVNPNTNTIYVASYNSSTINVIDGRTNSVMGSIDVGGSSPTSVLR